MGLPLVPVPRLTMGRGLSDLFDATFWPSELVLLLATGKVRGDAVAYDAPMHPESIPVGGRAFHGGIMAFCANLGQIQLVCGARTSRRMCLAHEGLELIAAIGCVPHYQGMMLGCSRHGIHDHLE